MKIKINNKKVKFEMCDNLFKNFRGFMFSKKKNIVLVANKESRLNSSIHSFFVFFPFNAIFLNSKKEVVDHKRIYPFTLCTPKRPAKYVLETVEEVKRIDKRFKF